MRVEDIVEGAVYHDGKAGVRRVVSISKEGQYVGPEVTYVILAAKVEREYVGSGYRYIIGDKSKCGVASFASWATSKLDEDGTRAVLDKLAAAKIRLSPGEDRFLRDVAAEVQSPTSATLISYNADDARAVGGLDKKGLVERRDGHEFLFTPLGLAKLKELPDA